MVYEVLLSLCSIRLRGLLLRHGGALQQPSLGNALVLEQYDTLRSDSISDAILVAMATPVFETFLDAGTIPFLQQHPQLKGPHLDALVERINRDEAMRQNLTHRWPLAGVRLQAPCNQVLRGRPLRVCAR